MQRRASEGVVVREAARGDCTAMAAVYTEAVRSGRSTMDTEPADEAEFAAKLAGLSERESLLVADVAGEVLGWGIVKRYSDRPGYAIACETSVYVAEAAQGRGLGSALQRAISARAGELGYHHLVAKIMGVNEGSVAFHERHGYELVGRQRDVGRLGGIYHDVVIMQRILTEEAREDRS